METIEVVSEAPQKAYRRRTAAYVLDVDIQTIDKLRKSGELPSIKLHGQVLIPVEGVEALLTQT